jgi:hypothetical protein
MKSELYSSSAAAAASSRGYYIHILYIGHGRDKRCNKKRKKDYDDEDNLLFSLTLF